MEKTEQVTKTEEKPKATFEDLCPDFNRQLEKDGYEKTRDLIFDGKSGVKRNLGDPCCCIVGEGHDLRF